MRILVTLAICLLVPVVSTAGFLSMEEGARATAMGGAFIAVADDATCIFWNPAGLALAHGLKLTGMRTSLFSVSGLSEDCLAAGYSGWRRSGFGFGWARAGVEDLYSEDTIVIGAGRKLFSENLAVGGALRIYSIEAPGYEYYNDPNFEDGDTGYAADFGLLYRSRQWSFAMLARNIGEPELSLIRTTAETDPIYSEVRIGGTYIFRDVMLISGEVRRPNGVPEYYDHKLSYCLGTEIWFFNTFALRTGLNRGRATAGLGLRVDQLTVDAGLLAERRPGNKYRLSVSLDF